MTELFIAALIYVLSTLLAIFSFVFPPDSVLVAVGSSGVSLQLANLIGIAMLAIGAVGMKINEPPLPPAPNHHTPTAEEVARAFAEIVEKEPDRFPRLALPEPSHSEKCMAESEKAAPVVVGNSKPPRPLKNKPEPVDKDD